MKIFVAILLSKCSIIFYLKRRVLKVFASQISLSL